MSEAAEETKEGEQKGGKSKLIIIVAVVLVLAGGGFFGYTKFMKKPAEEGGGGEGHAAAPAKVEEPVIQEMETFIVNLADPSGKRYLKITMKAKMSGQPGAAEFTARNFEMRDAVLMILSAKESEDISRPEDKLNLKKEIVATLNKALHNGKIQDLYFTEFLIQ
ncbi:MAG: flagellar basal body-associated protein FliL [Acidobacteriota bacterium]